jgi:hypothetical protein
VTRRPDDPPLEGDETEVLEEGDATEDSGTTLQGDATETLPLSAGSSDDGGSV